MCPGSVQSVIYSGWAVLCRRDWYGVGKENGVGVKRGGVASGCSYPHRQISLQLAAPQPSSLGPASGWGPCRHRPARWGDITRPSPSPMIIASWEEGPPEMCFQLLFREMDSLAGEVLPRRTGSTEVSRTLSLSSPRAWPRP